MYPDLSQRNEVPILKLEIAMGLGMNRIEAYRDSLKLSVYVV